MTDAEPDPRFLRQATALALRVNPEKVFETLIEAYRDVRGIEEEEATKRAKIRADSEARIAEIALHRDAMLSYLDASFDERKENFERLFALADAALDSNDTEKLQTTLGAVVELAKSSPFKELASIAATRQALADKEQEWNL